MNGIKDISVNLNVISPENDNCFFGYYDLNAYDSTGKVHLAARTSFIDRIPTSEDVLDQKRCRQVLCFFPLRCEGRGPLQSYRSCRL